MIEVPVGTKSIEQYSDIVGREQVERIRELGGALKDARVLHLSSLPYGRGASELINSLAPLMNDVGLKAEWQALERDDDFSAITAVLYNSLQGMGAVWTREMADEYIARSREYVKSVGETYDFVIVHDPQPAVIAGMLEEESRRQGKWIWRCHLDMSTPDPEAWELLKSLLAHCYECAVFTSDSCMPPDFEIDSVLIPPAIDPLNPRNVVLEPYVSRSAVMQYGLDPDLPLAVQVSRFDPWNDPMGVIEAVLLAREQVPDLQLLLLGSVSSDDPEGYHYYRKTARKAAEFENIRLLTTADGIGNLEVNAFQRAASVVIQKSVREGFGLTISEGLWKYRPVVAGNVGGIPLQVEDGVTGFLVDTVEECANRVVYLLENPGEGDRMGDAGHQRVLDRFLAPRHLEDYLELLNRLSDS